MPILLVDDERLVRICTEMMLREQLGPALICGHAGSAAQAEAWIRDNGPPDLCIVDYKMPLCSGAELTAKLRPRFPGTKWVLVSGYEISPDLLYSRGGCADCILSKPVSPEDLAALLKNFGMEVKNHGDPDR